MRVVSGRSGARRAAALWLVAGALCLLLAGCGRATTQPPRPSQGTFTSAQYHFRVSYPVGWVANACPSAQAGADACGGFHVVGPGGQSTSIPFQPSQINPLTLTITRATARPADGSFISTFTVAVFTLSDPTIAHDASILATDTSKHQVALAGMAAYMSTPLRQQVPGSDVMATHTDYYLVHGAYEYQISTDAVSNDQADTALVSILRSFTILQ